MAHVLKYSKTICAKVSQLKFVRLYSTTHNTVSQILHQQQEKSDDPSLWVKSPFPDVTIPNGIRLIEYLKEGMGPWENCVAFECAVTHRKYKHIEVYKMSKSFGASLIQSGLQRGDVIGIVLQNIPEYASIMYGIWEAGGIASPVNPSYTPDEIQRQLLLSDAVQVVTTKQFLPTIQTAINSGICPKLKSIILVQDSDPNCHNFNDMIQTNPNHVKFPKFSEDDIKNETSLLPFSSGTTGPPKGVCLTQYNLLSNLIQCSIPELIHRPRLGNPDQERLIGLLPFFHSYGMAVFLALGMYTGAHTLCLPKFEADLFLKSIQYHKPTALHLVTPLINLIVQSPSYTAKELESVELIVAGAAPTGPSLIKKLCEKGGKKFLFREGYGMTELSPVSHLLPPDPTYRKLGSCGVPVPNVVTKIVDISTGRTLGRNEHGEVCVKGPQMMKGYYKNEEATRNTIDEDGWLHTGDIGFYDDDGFCFIVDRLKELIKVKGFQVSPSELEDVLRKHPGVNDVAVIGVPDMEWGEAPRAYIISKNDQVNEDTINSFLKEKVSHYKQLKGGIEFVKEIPKAPTGKILRRELILAYKRANNIPI